MRRRIGPNTVVVVVGASSGIGRATAHRFAERGTRLVLAARSLDSLHEVADECRARGAEAIAIRTDITLPGELEHLVNAAVSRFGGIDVWVAAASVFGYGAIDRMPSEIARSIIDTNVHGTIDGVRLALPALRVRRGVVIVIGSVFSALPSSEAWAYVTSKHAIAGFAASIRQELHRGSDPVDVAMVWPSTVDTPIYQHAANFTGRAVHPIPPLVEPDRVARTIVRIAARPRRRRIVGVVQGMAVPLHAVAPAFADRLLAIAMRVFGLRAHNAPDRDGTVNIPDPASNRIHGDWRNSRVVILAALAVGIVAATVLRRRRLDTRSASICARSGQDAWDRRR